MRPHQAEPTSTKRTSCTPCSGRPNTLNTCSNRSCSCSSNSNSHVNVSSRTINTTTIMRINNDCPPHDPQRNRCPFTCHSIKSSKSTTTAAAAAAALIWLAAASERIASCPHSKRRPQRAEIMQQRRTQLWASSLCTQVKRTLMQQRTECQTYNMLYYYNNP